MTINFIPNDPNAQDDMPERQQPARPDRPAGRANFNFEAHAPEGEFAFDQRDFLFWQSREAALAAVETWESYAGNLTSWANRSANPSRIDISLTFDDGEIVGPQRLNAFYDGRGVRFFDFDDGTTTTFSAASTDTVSHEVGHALLDSQRPELFGSSVPEVGAFHEAFGDITALLTALSDQATRIKLLAITPDLSKPNFVEANSEYLSAAIRKQFGDVNPSQPRHALNQFKWQLPSTLPVGAFTDPPERLSRESHNFSRVFSGAFYDTVRAVFTSGDADDEAALLTAARTCGRLLVEAVRQTPETARYFQAVGRAMVKVDDQLNDGAHRDAIGKAFADHAIMLGSAAMTAPTAALAGPAPKILKTKATIAPSTLSDLRQRIGAKPGARFAVRPLSMLGDDVAEAVHRREVPLGTIDRRLRGVIAYAAEPVLVGRSGSRAAVLGALPEPNRTEDEVGAFVETLLGNGRIALDTRPTRGAKKGAKKTLVAVKRRSNDLPTHVIRTVGGKKVLTRIRFLCGCCRG
ncbi:MAG: hypothetical protein JOY90_22060 [Bradyrhizobium sp.]|uniref:hypothetical protein n=1 Tax=Bradyrhizobium sp. TaxID=376 RepID=UPI001DCD2D22|nr:hypothetical protein [Bradyrhizobium sp.]MBV9563103.1 hypothetical protein [Bradyrhizobium sp.]